MHFGLYAATVISFLVIQLCFVVRCIISCENVERMGEKLGIYCKILHTEVRDPHLKEQLMDLSTLISGLPLSFSISGYFKINRGLIPSLISGITSYMIILIQFKVQALCGSTPQGPTEHNVP
uniref:Gustatory and odorant receptor 22-like n=1 Tax=Diabrotica virgifera virgifera TaxID=50390 RepID=A0A6P7F4W2_DIAVI